MADRFPDYDVLAKRDTPSWNNQTRAAIDKRLALLEERSVLTDRQLQTLRAVAGRIVPQPEGRPPINTVAIVLDKIAHDRSDGFRHHQLPHLREAWERGLNAIEAEAQARHCRSFAALETAQMDLLLAAVERGDISDSAWDHIDARLFWKWRLLSDIVSAYYTHPSAWSAIGFGGPASPRGYVRLAANMRDSWEAVERAEDSTVLAEGESRDR